MTTQRFFNNDLELKFNAIGDKLYNLRQLYTTLLKINI